MISKYLILFSVTLFLSFQVHAKDYYIDPSSGNDELSGTAESRAWRSGAPAAKVSFKPGDRLLIRAGDTLLCAIELENLKGSIQSPITIDRYGTGVDPVIDGNGANAALYFLNPSYITIRNLTVINPNGKYGINLIGHNAGELNLVSIKNVEVHSVNEATFEETNPSKVIGGIVFKVEKGDTPTWWNGILIDQCFIHDLGSCGISIGSDYKAVKDIKPGARTYPILGVTISNNKIHNIVRDGAIIRQCKGGVMEYNEVSRTGLTAISNGMWWYDSEDCITQFNEGHHCKAALDKDGAPFSLDNSTVNCIIQYNYSHDNEGAGYMLFGHNDEGYGNVIQYNLSVNDHLNNISSGIGSIAAVSRVRDALVLGNIVVAGDDTESILGHRDWDGIPIYIRYENNLFIGNGKAYLGHQVLPAGKFDNNYFIDIPNLPNELLDGNSLEGFYTLMQKIERIKMDAGKK